MVESASSSGETTECSFICETEGWLPPECNPFAQDCPPGEKCTAYADDGGNVWNNNKCVPVMGDQQPGEPCTAVESGVSGLDDCALGSMCFDTDVENKGVCYAFCQGNPETPICEPPNTVCVIYADAVIPLCHRGCDPLAQDCDQGDVCIGNPSGDRFLCVLDASGDEGQVHDPCEYANACDPGLICLSSTAAEECDPMAGGCCQPFCAVSLGDAQCAGQGQQCIPYYEPPHPGDEDVGYCSLP